MKLLHHPGNYYCYASSYEKVYYKISELIFLNLMHPELSFLSLFGFELASAVSDSIYFFM